MQNGVLTEEGRKEGKGRIKKRERASGRKEGKKEGREGGRKTEKVQALIPNFCQFPEACVFMVTSGSNSFF